MKIKIENYDKWYETKQHRNTVVVYIKKIIIEEYLKQIYNLFKSKIKHKKVVICFANSNYFEEEHLLEPKLSMSLEFLQTNSHNFQYIYNKGIERMLGLVEIDQEKINYDIFCHLITSFESLQIYGITDDISFNFLLDLTANGEDTEFNILNIISEIFLTIYYGGNELRMGFDKTKINYKNILEDIRTIF